MKIYTKGGDKGDTQIYAKEVVRVSKDDPVLECYGTLDELNAHIGVLASQLKGGETISTLHDIQQALFQIGFAVSSDTHLSDQDVESLEADIDQMQSALPAQTHFILPGGTQPAALAHLCRTVARRAERRLVSVAKGHPVPEVCVRYLNRLSDYFFVLARQFNHQASVADIIVK